MTPVSRSQQIESIFDRAKQAQKKVYFLDGPRATVAKHGGNVTTKTVYMCVEGDDQWTRLLDPIGRGTQDER